MMVKHWIRALRLRTLPLALASIGMGTFLSASAGNFKWDIFIGCVLTTVFLQVLSNLANDYGDSIHGADSVEREGPQRAVQAGVISAGAMRKAIILLTGLSFASGVALLYFSFGWSLGAFLVFLGIGLVAIVAAVTYTAGNKPYGYAGLGDFSVLIFFGFVAVMGSAYLYEHTVRWQYVLPAISTGLFSVAVLNLNNIRDIVSDKKAGKFSIPVRIGRSKAVLYHWLLLLLGLLCAVFYVLKSRIVWTELLFLLVTPLFLINAQAVYRKEDPKELDPFLKQMAISTLLFVLVFGIGQLLASRV